MSVLGALPAPPAVGVALCLLVALAAAFSPAAAAASSSPRVSEAEAIRVADRDANVIKERAENGGLGPVASMVDGNWEVAYFAAWR